MSMLLKDGQHTYFAWARNSFSKEHAGEQATSSLVRSKTSSTVKSTSMKGSKSTT